MNDAFNIVDKGTYYEIDVNQKPVTRCMIDNAFTIDVSEMKFILAISFEGKFTYIIDTNTERSLEYRLEAGVTPESLCPALSVLHKRIELITVLKIGEVTVRFTDGSLLWATSTPEYESWNITGAGDLKIFCLPGGNLAVWLPKTDP